MGKAHTREEASSQPLGLMKFLDFRAQPCEASTYVEKRRQSTQCSKATAAKKMSYTVAADDGCNLCESRHPLYACKQYRQLSHDDKLALLMEQRLCMNCFCKGRIARKCPAASMCTKCDRPYHTLLHIEEGKLNSEKKRRAPL